MSGERRKPVYITAALVAGVLVLFFLNLCFGTVHIPFRDVIASLAGGGASRESWDFIIRESRLPSAVTALLAGASLAASGLMLQTAFRNPLAGPDILGINGGAGLGVALVMLLFGGNLTMGNLTLGGSVSVIIGAFAGAIAVTALVLFLSARLKNPVMLLIVGIMVSYLASALISLLNFFSTAEGVHSYTMWGMGNFSGVSMGQLPVYCVVSAAGLLIAVSLIKPLNALLLGDMYAENLGVNIIRTRNWLLLSTSLLVAIITAFCGPVSFIGLAVPHIGRLMLQSSNHRSLMPVTILTGAVVALLCNVLSSIPGNRGLIPLNAITPAIGAPVILYVLLKNRHNQL
ncbi:MAG: iron ABC transporter permease [Bacteroidaceae bacterium]|nr:iron ABC transporter permease [Bacteroidaceae bacterium]